MKSVLILRKSSFKKRKETISIAPYTHSINNLLESNLTT